MKRRAWSVLPRSQKTREEEKTVKETFLRLELPVNGHFKPQAPKGKKTPWRVLLLAFSMLITTAGVAQVAQISTIPGTLTLSSTFESISVRGKFTGDSNSNNSASIQFRKVGEGAWHNAYTPIIDRRSSINGISNAAYVSEARGSIVGLTENTAYEVQLTWNDPDGVEGSPSIIGTVSTLSYTPPSNGTTRWVDASAVEEGSGAPSSPFKSITYAIEQSIPGDTIIVKAGTYPALTISKSGTASAYFILKANPGDIVILQNGTRNLTLNANYWRIIGFSFAVSTESLIKIGAGQHHIFIEESNSTDFGTANVWGTGAVEISDSANNIFILKNDFNRINTGPDNVNGIFITGSHSHTIVIADNILNGPVRDGIGNAGNSFDNGLAENCDVARNTITNYQDDSVELDGSAVNLRVWGNYIRSNAASLMSEAGTLIGPSYIFRNVMASAGNGGSGLKQGNGGVGYCFIFHNVIENMGSGANEAVGQAGGTPQSESHVFRNNILRATGNIYYREGRSNSYDYSVMYNPGYLLVDSWNGSSNYSTLAAFQNATGQELHGINADPLMNADKTLRSGSPAADRGIPIPNFNSLDSAWPYSGSGPDIGAFEYSGTGGDITLPSAPKNLRVR